MKKKIILSAVVSIVMCLALIAGATFALFTSEQTISASVEAANVELKATVENIQYTSTLGTTVPESAANFDTATQTITLEKIVPGDVVSFDIRVQNLSDITVNYRTVLKMVSDTGLWAGLTVTIDGVAYDGSEINSGWSSVGPGAADVIVSVSITLPEAAGNEYMLDTCTISYFVEAIQGNVDTTTLP